MTGHWTDPYKARRLLPAGDVSFVGRARRAYSVMRGGKVIGSIRYHANAGNPCWMVSLPGFMFDTVPGQGAARFGVKQTPVKAIKGAKAARAAITNALRQLEALPY
jgi:hypothetical protein